MSYKASAWAVKQRVGNPTRKLVLLALAENANHNGYSPVGFKYLSDVAECSTKSVQRHLEALESMGLVVRQRRRRQDGSLAGYDMWLQLHQTQFQFEDEPPADNLTSGQNDHWTPAEGTESPLVEDRESSGEGQRVHSFPSVSSPVERENARAKPITAERVRKVLLDRGFEHRQVTNASAVRLTTEIRELEMTEAELAEAIELAEGQTRGRPDSPLYYRWALRRVTENRGGESNETGSAGNGASDDLYRKDYSAGATPAEEVPAFLRGGGTDVG